MGASPPRRGDRAGEDDYLWQLLSEANSDRVHDLERARKLLGLTDPEMAARIREVRRAHNTTPE